MTKLGLKELRRLIRRMPFNGLLGLDVARVHPDGVTLAVPLRDELRNSAGVMHGGVTAALADAAMGFAIARHFGGKRRAVTVEMKISYFRPIAKGRLFGRAKLLRIGRHLIVGNVDLLDDDRNLAGTAIVTYIFVE